MGVFGRMSKPLALAFVGRPTAVLIGAGLLRLGGEYPDPLAHANGCAPLQATSEAT
jgi:hypothetical protein